MPTRIARPTSPPVFLSRVAFSVLRKTSSRVTIGSSTASLLAGRVSCGMRSPIQGSQLAACIYCGKPADSDEHIVATRFIDVLKDDPRGLPLPVTLTISTGGDFQKRIVGRTRKRKPTLEYTTRVCASCNNGWMNEVDSLAFDDVSEMIRGNAVTLDTARQSAMAAWVCKVAVTARSEPNYPMPIEKEWTDWLFQQHSAIPGWYVWVGHYIGSAPWWYSPHDVSTPVGQGSPTPPPGSGIGKSHGVMATMAIGHLVTQVFGVSGGGILSGPDESGTLPSIWPTNTAPVPWPPPQHIDDAGLPAWSQRLLSNKSAISPPIASDQVTGVPARRQPNRQQRRAEERGDRRQRPHSSPP